MPQSQPARREKDLHLIAVIRTVVSIAAPRYAHASRVANTADSTPGMAGILPAKPGQNRFVAQLFAA